MMLQWCGTPCSLHWQINLINLFQKPKETDGTRAATLHAE